MLIANRYLKLLPVIFLIVCGLLFIRFTWTESIKKSEVQELIEAKITEEALNGEMIYKLKGESSDIGTTAYESIKKRLVSIRALNTGVRFIYIYTLKNNQIYIMADSEPPENEDYSPPGQIYEEADSQFFMPFSNGEPLITRPVKDRWGRWISILVPVKKTADGKTIAVLGVDYNADDWYKNAFIDTIYAVVAVLSVLLSILLFYKIIHSNTLLKKELRLNKSLLDSLNESRNEYMNLFNYAPAGVFTVHEGVFDKVNPAAETILGYTASQLKTIPFVDLIHPDDKLEVIERHYIRMSGEEVETGYTFRILSGDGRTRWVEITSALVEIDNKPSALNYIIDVTGKHQAEEALKKRERYLSSILKITGDGFWVVNADSRLSDVNDAYCRMSGYSKEEINGLFIHDIDIDEDPDETAARINRIILNDYEVFERRHRKKDGLFIEVEVSASWLDIDDGIIICFCREITDRKENERRLEKQNRINKALTDASIQILAYDSFKVNARKIFDAVCSLTGATSGYVALLSDNGDENEVLFLESGGFDCRVDPSLPMPVRGLRAEAYRTCRPVFDNDFASSEWIEYIPEGHSPLSNVMFAPLVIEGKSTGLIGVANKPEPFNDEDAQVAWTFAGLAAISLNNSRMLEQLNLSEKKYKLLFEYSNDSILLLGLSDKTIPDKLLNFNQRTLNLLDYSSEELNNKSFKNIVPDEVIGDAAEIIRQLRGKDRLIFESSMLKKEGMIFPVEVSATLINADGEEALLCHIRDITKRKLAEAEAASLLKERELILREVHHRIKNNMNSIYGMILLKAATLKEPDSKTALQDTANRVRSMGLLYDKLYKSNDFIDVPVKNYLETLAHEITSNHQTDRTIEVETHIDEFTLDIKRLQSIGIIINELITNMIKYAFAGKEAGLISLSAVYAGNNVTLTVADNGIGLPESVTFENSTGFGMQLVGMLAEQIDANVTIKREGGTIFIFEFEI